MKGLIHIYCGDGKGKTSAALGLALRMIGCERQVFLVRFLKNESSSELEVLKSLKGVNVVTCSKSFGFYNRMSEAQKREARNYYSQMLYSAVNHIQQGSYGLLIMDEILAAYRHEFVDQKLLLTFLKNKPVNLEVVLTGRDPAPELLELADYVTEMKKLKHPYDTGISARRGVEY